MSVVRGWVPSQLWNGGDFSQAFFDIILGPTTLSFWILFRLGFFFLLGEVATLFLNIYELWQVALGWKMLIFCSEIWKKMSFFVTKMLKKRCETSLLCTPWPKFLAYLPPFTADVFSSLDLIHLFPKFPAFWFLKKNRHVTQKSSHAKIALVEL